MNQEQRETPAVDLVLLFICLSWAGTHSMVKVLLEVMPAFGLTGLRFAVMVAISLAVLAVLKPRFAREDWGRIFLVAMLSYGVYQFAYVLGVSYGGAFVSGVLIAMVPVFAMITGALTKIEVPTRNQVIGITLAVLCAAGFSVSSHSPGSGSILGAGLILFACVLFGAYAVAVKPLAQKYSTWALISIQVVIGGLPLVFVGLPELIRQNWSLLALSDWLMLAFLSTIPAYVAYAAWNWAISHVGAARTSAAALLVPILASVISLVFLKEPFNYWSLIFAAGLLVSLGITRLQPNPV